MNKELIKKYKTEFDHWLNGGEVLFFTWKWYNSKDNLGTTFNHSEPEKIKHYVINDEYVELRKAIAEGKTIQYRNINVNGFENWEDLNGLSFNPNFEHRIKPEELQFKVGDWLINEKPDYNFGKEPSKPFMVTQDWIDHINKFGQTYGGNTAKTGPLENFKHWKPQPGEWCWFFNKDKIPVISQFCEIKNGKYFAFCSNKPHQLGSWYKYCEPFIGTLPTCLKD